MSSTPHEDETCQPLPQHSVCPIIVIHFTSSPPSSSSTTTNSALPSLQFHFTPPLLPSSVSAFSLTALVLPSSTYRSLISAVSHPPVKHVYGFFLRHQTHTTSFFLSQYLRPPPITPLCSSTVFKLSSKDILPVFSPVNWALWWTVNKPVNHFCTCFLSHLTTDTLYRILRAP